MQLRAHFFPLPWHRTSSVLRREDFPGRAVKIEPKVGGGREGKGVRDPPSSSPTHPEILLSNLSLVFLWVTRRFCRLEGIGSVRVLGRRRDHQGPLCHPSSLAGPFPLERRWADTTKEGATPRGRGGSTGKQE